MEIGQYAIIMTFILSAGTVIFAALLWLSTINATRHHALLDMHKEYADPKMKKTVKNLWDFYKKECDGLTQISREEDEEADRKLRSKYKDILEAKKSAKKYEKYNLDDSRRYVIHFYFHMADIYFNNIIGNHCLKTTKKLLFYYWDETNLRIIRKILNPLDEVRAKHDGFEEEQPVQKKLRDFYQNALEFCDP